MARPLAFVLPLGVDSFAVDDGAAEPQCGWRRFVATTKATSSSGLGDILRSRARPGRPLEDGVLAVVVAGAVDGEAQVMAEPAASGPPAGSTQPAQADAAWGWRP